jgi:hypothetical protein
MHCLKHVWGCAVSLSRQPCGRNVQCIWVPHRYGDVGSHHMLQIKGKVVPVLNELSTTPSRRMGEWMCRSTFSWPRHELEVSGQLHAPAALTPGKSPGTHWIGGWVDHRAGLDNSENRKFLTLPALELRPLSRPTCSQSLYRLRYPDA